MKQYWQQYYDEKDQDGTAAASHPQNGAATSAIQGSQASFKGSRGGIALSKGGRQKLERERLEREELDKERLDKESLFRGTTFYDF